MKNTIVFISLVLISIVTIGVLLPAGTSFAEEQPITETPGKNLPTATTTAAQPPGTKNNDLTYLPYVVRGTESTSTPTAMAPTTVKTLAKATTVPSCTPIVAIPDELAYLTVDVETDLVFFIVGKVNVKAEIAYFAPIIKFITESLNVSSDNGVVKSVPTFARLAPSSVKVPVMSVLGVPCMPGEKSWITGTDWLAKPNHKAIDIACLVRGDRGRTNDYFIPASPTDTVVLAIITQDNVAYNYNSSGVTVLLKTQLPAEGYKVGNTVLKGGSLIFVYGHMDADYKYNNISYKGLVVDVGQQLRAGDPIGFISRKGTTGNTTGPHIHYAVIWEKPGGQLEFMDPNRFSALGTRPK